MTAARMSVGELIARLDTDLPDASSLEKISEAKARAHTLAAMGDQLIGHYVTQAREDGASWSEIGDAIGVSKQAAQQKHAATALYGRFTDRARHSIVLAQEIARQHRHDFVGTEHLLLGLLAETDGIAARILVERAGSADAVRAAVEAIMPEPGKKTPGTHIPFTPRVKKALELAGPRSAALNHDFIGTEHLLLGLSALGEGVAADALRSLHLDTDTLQDAVRAKVDEHLSQPPDSTP